MGNEDEIAEQFGEIGRNLIEQLAQQREAFLAAHLHMAGTHEIAQWPYEWRSEGKVRELRQLLILIPKGENNQRDTTQEEMKARYPHHVIISAAFKIDNFEQGSL